jgi:hypothetical protein
MLVGNSGVTSLLGVVCAFDDGQCRGSVDFGEALKPLDGVDVEFVNNDR